MSEYYVCAEFGKEKTFAACEVFDSFEDALHWLATNDADDFRNNPSITLVGIYELTANDVLIPIKLF